MNSVPQRQVALLSEVATAEAAEAATAFDPDDDPDNGGRQKSR